MEAQQAIERLRKTLEDYRVPKENFEHLNTLQSEITDSNAKLARVVERLEIRLSWEQKHGTGNDAEEIESWLNALSEDPAQWLEDQRKAAQI